MPFAAQTHVDNSCSHSFAITESNAYGTDVLLETCNGSGQILRFIHVSTDRVYGETAADVIEDTHEAAQ